MASLVLTTIGGALGGAVGGPIGAALGQMGGALAGRALGLDGSGAGSPRVAVGPRLTALNGVGSTEGAPIVRVFGRARIGGQMIWATRFTEHVGASAQASGGGKASSSSPRTVDVTYSYTADFAIGLCEGPIAFVRRVWADGREIDLTSVTMRVYHGTEDQEADPLIAAKEKPGAVPAYRGLAYVVFEALPLGPFGNRIPQLSFEVVRPVEGVGSMIRAVNLIPGATEFGYGPTAHISMPGPGKTVVENRNQSFAASDWAGSLDALQALCPNLRSVALVVCWFGDDLRAGRCRIAPRVDNRFKTLSYPLVPLVVEDWAVAGLVRADAQLVSFVDDAASYGGTPSDGSVIAAIRDLRARGLFVTLYPFVMMDVAADNGRADPWTGAASQPPYPWRGRITCDPAPGRPGSPDGTMEAGAQVASFFGTAKPGPGEWSYRRLVLHYAALAREAGGVDAFLLGSELAALTRVRSAPGVYPAANALAALAVDAKTVLGPHTNVSYAADWTEYGAHVLDGGREVRFPLDVVWASAAVDFVGIDAYWPVSDWRDGDHLDAGDASSVYDLDHLRRRMGSGEAFDWFYPNAEARAAQSRAPITDGAYGKPWVFRQKDIRNWWSQPHVERVGGVETAATAWTPGSKPIWFTETGCPAVDRGANAPNLFPDPKSSESGVPPFSRGFRDDLMQARFIEAVMRRFDPASPDFREADNPLGPHGVRMVDPERIHVWAWDARPFPAFPALPFVWADAAAWRTGHWLNGRLEGVPLDRLLTALTDEVAPPRSQVYAGCANILAMRPRPDVEGFLDGYVLDRPMSMRDAIEPLCDLFGFDPVVSSGAIRFVSRARKPVARLTADDLVPAKDGSLLRITRVEETELPHELAVSFGDADGDYAPAAVLSRRIEGWSRRQSQAETALMTNRASAQRQADQWLDDLWAARETASFDLDPRLLQLEPGDIVELDGGGAKRALRIAQMSDGSSRGVVARAVDAALFDRPVPDAPAMPPRGARPPVFGPACVVMLDLAVARGDPVALQYVAATADPWPGALHVYRNVRGETNSFVAALPRRATIGETLDPLPPGPVGRWDRGGRFRVRLFSGALASHSDAQVLAGASTFAVRGGDGAWEILSAARAELVDADTYLLSRLLRGQSGEEHLAGRSVPAGATIVLMDEAVVPLASELSMLGVETTWRLGPANRDPGDPSFVDVTAIVTPKALMPYAPVGARATRAAEGIRIAWTRRGRVESDAWEPTEIPLGEDGERYTVAVSRPQGAPRVLETTAPEALYAAADVAADFGSAPATLSLVIRQVSATVGPGFPLAATVPVR